MATNDKIKMLLDTIARLRNLIQKENELLLNPGNKEELKQLLEEKKRLPRTMKSTFRVLK